MDTDDLESQQQKPALKNLEEVSIEALAEYIAELEAEIARVREAIKGKTGAQSDADQFFKTSGCGDPGTGFFLRTSATRWGPEIKRLPATPNAARWGSRNPLVLSKGRFSAKSQHGSTAEQSQRLIPPTRRSHSWRGFLTFTISGHFKVTISWNIEATRLSVLIFNQKLRCPG